ncbi:MAG: response regulator transcription factor [Deltaproteobacteria bacterium]|jgi:two-component system invasion response regulator UvrY|nr:response regulator transcription factor [Deltaproteobacteria bacterium]
MRNVLIADDHQVTRRGLRELLRDAISDLEIVEVADVPSVLLQVTTRRWDLILLDVLMPGGNVLDVLKVIRETGSTIPVLVLTAATEIEYVVQTMHAGANGLIHKHRAADDLLDAIQKVLAGGSYLHPETAAEVAARLRQAAPTALPHERLSVRELEIFRAIARGRAIKEIAGDLGLSDKTVATYLGRIREKTGLSSHVDIARYALHHHLVE